MKYMVFAQIVLIHVNRLLEVDAPTLKTYSRS